MKEVTLQIPDSQYPFFMELVNKLKFAKVAQPKKTEFTPEQQEYIADLKQSLHEVDLHLQGKIKLKSLDELLGEL